MIAQLTRKVLGNAAVCAAIVATVSAQVWAEAQSPSSGETPSITGAKDGVVLEELVVTATRREERLQDVPFSIMAFGADQIAQQRIERPEDLFRNVPGVTFIPVGRTSSFLSIRGMTGTLASPAADLPIAYFLDDVYVSGLADLNLNLYDVERIEVLRGPQGTLFGRNVIGGAISIASARPQFHDEFGGKVSVGNRDRVDADGYLNSVLSADKLALRLAVSSRNADGQIFNRVRDEWVEDDDSQSARASLLFTPTDAVSGLLSLDYSKENGTAGHTKILGGSPALFPALSTDPWTIDTDGDPSYDKELFRATQRLDWETSVGTLTSITGYRRNLTHSNVDSDATSLPIVFVSTDIDKWQISQELRFASPVADLLSYIAGLYYLELEDASRANQSWNPLPGTVLAFALGPGLKQNVVAQEARVRSYAVFGEASYQITPVWQVALGARMTVDEKSGLVTVTGPLNPAVKVIPGDMIVPFSESWDAFTPRVILRYTPSEQVSLYATVSRGFKGGGFTPQVTEQGTRTPFDPEYATNYELGTKSTFLDRRLSVNATLFRQETTDLQVNSFNDFGQRIISNAGEALSQGLELETAALIGEHLQVNLNYTWLDTEYEKFRTGTSDFSGNPLPFAPKNSVGLNARYAWPVGAIGEIAMNAGYTYKSRLSLQDANVPLGISEKSVVRLLDASIEYVSANGRWTVSLWGKNLTDRQIVQSANDLTSFWASFGEFLAGQKYFYATYNQPRTYGISFAYQR